jgi:short-subunit dehydrogenase
MKNLQGKVAVITGAGSGIGRALALELAAQGCALAISDVNAVGLEQTRVQIGVASSSKVRTYIFDVSDQAATEAHAKQVAEDFGQVNLLINNAGVALSGKIRDIEMSDFHWLMNINFWGVVHGTQAFLPALIASGDAHIVNLSSIFGMISVPKQATYNAAKFAVRGYTEALRQEMRMDNLAVQVSCVYPGGINTDIARNARVAACENKEQTAALFSKLARTSPEQAAAIILRGIKRNKPRIMVGMDAHFVHFLYRLLGIRYQYITRALAAKMGY